MEQRNGRIDRHGQEGILNEKGEKIVLVYHFVGPGVQGS